MALTISGLRCASVKLWAPFTGTWTAEVDYDLPDTNTPLAGAVILVVDGATLRGTIDPTASGRFGNYARARVIGGAGGWVRRVGPQEFHNDAGQPLAYVIAATAAEVGEVIGTTTTAIGPADYERVAGPASRVLAGLDWYVDAAGVTHIGQRLEVPAAATSQVLTYDPQDRVATLSVEGLLAPGTVIADPRFGSITVRDVEQTFADGKARTTAWCGVEAKSRAAALFGALVREHGRVGTLKAYRYRVDVQSPLDGRLRLQAVNPGSGAPDTVALPPWYGVPGVEALIPPGTECVVQFLDGDPAQPVVTSFAPGAAVVKVGGEQPVALAAPLIAAIKAGLGADPISGSAQVLAFESAIAALSPLATKLLAG